ncbi:YkgJ family cysteine cluster protein [Candidatus Woesearchaeota archaeon]|nr:YkgJ family cysteine cluster protein [Candidatus Woesearchaeota archaeon]
MIKIPVQGEIPKFECRKCGNCCKVLSTKPLKETPYFMDRIIICVANTTLPMHDWEMGEFKKKGYDNLIVPSKIIYDLNSNKSIIIEYTLTQNNCPQLENNLCSIYENRPLVCKSFPCSYFINIDKENKVGNLVRGRARTLAG